MDRVIGIRPATEGDLPLLLTLIRELAAYEHLEHECVLEEGLLRRHLFGPRPALEALVGTVDGEAAGYASFFHNFSTFTGRPGLFVEDVFVRPAFRRLGLGRAFWGHMARLAVERGCGRMEWTVLDWNEPAIRFYESLGARMHQAWRIMRVTGPDIAALADGPGGDDRP